MNNVRICRATWLNGRTGRSTMTNNDNHSCCLGFGMRQVCGPITNTIMRNEPEPDSVCYSYMRQKNARLGSLRQIKNIDLFVNIETDEYNGLTFTNSDFATKAMEINDAKIDEMPDEIRELKLIELFSQYGLNLEFYGNYATI